MCAKLQAQLRDVHAQMDRLYNDAGKKHVDVATDDYDERIAAYDATIAQWKKTWHSTQVLHRMHRQPLRGWMMKLLQW